MTEIVFLLFALVMVTFFLGVSCVDECETWPWRVALGIAVLLFGLAIVCKAYDFKYPKPKTEIHQSGTVNWGTVDSTLKIGTNQFEVEVGVHYDGTLQYRKGKQK